MCSDTSSLSEYLHPYACFRCRKSFRRALRPQVILSCPNCGGPSIGLNRKFKAPKTSDIKQWAKVEILVRHGFFFQSVGEPYPDDLRSVDEFIKRHSARVKDLRERFADSFAQIEEALLPKS